MRIGTAAADPALRLRVAVIRRATRHLHRRRAGQPKRQRGRAHRLDQPALVAGHELLPEGAPLERREQQEGALDAGRASRVGQALRRRFSERAIDEEHGRHVASLELREGLIGPADALHGCAGRGQAGRQERRLERRSCGDQDPLSCRGRAKPDAGSAVAAGKTTSKPKIEPPPSRSVSVSAPPMRSTIRREIASPSPVPPCWRAVVPSACSNSSKIASRRSGRTPGPVSFDREADAAVGRGLDQEADATPCRELDRVAGQIGEHLSQSDGVAPDARGKVRRDQGRDLEALVLSARRQELDDALDQRREIEDLVGESRAFRLRCGRNRGSRRSASRGPGQMS